MTKFEEAKMTKASEGTIMTALQASSRRIVIVATHRIGTAAWPAQKERGKPRVGRGTSLGSSALVGERDVQNQLERQMNSVRVRMVKIMVIAIV